MRAHPLIKVVLVLLLLATWSSPSVGQQSPTPIHSTRIVPTTLSAIVLDAELKTPSGRPFKLADYSGTVLVINLWATWCGPCRLETPELVKLHKQFRSRGFEIIGLLTDDPKASDDDLRTWIQRYRLLYLIGRNTPDVARTLGQGSRYRDILPQTIIVSRSGRIVRHFVGFNFETTPRQWRQAVTDALNEKTFSTNA